MSRHSIVVASFSAMLLISATTVASARSRPSAAMCEINARNYAYNLGRQGPIIGSTAFGSLAGFGLGSIWAASGIGAAIGAGVGLIGGMIAQSAANDDAYRATYQDCMAGRVL